MPESDEENGKLITKFSGFGEEYRKKKEEAGFGKGKVTGTFNIIGNREESRYDNVHTVEKGECEKEGYKYFYFTRYKQVLRADNKKDDYLIETFLFDKEMESEDIKKYLEDYDYKNKVGKIEKVLDCKKYEKTDGVKDYDYDVVYLENISDYMKIKNESEIYKGMVDEHENMVYLLYRKNRGSNEYEKWYFDEDFSITEADDYITRFDNLKRREREEEERVTGRDKKGGELRSLSCYNYQEIRGGSLKEILRKMGIMCDNRVIENGGGVSVEKYTYIDRNREERYMLERTRRGEKNGKVITRSQAWEFRENFNRESALYFIKDFDRSRRKENTVYVKQKRKIKI